MVRKLWYDLWTSLSMEYFNNNKMPYSSKRKNDGPIDLIIRLYNKYGNELKQYKHQGDDIIIFVQPQVDFIDLLNKLKEDISAFVKFNTPLQLYFEQNGIREGININRA
ncbi:hypothetical protein FA048_06720 [Pedobacter polaris]|uniref:Uncharacterized protein n=1 Tax=Pedobacter polaris TaxID=2571273 RepID=A0A4U1CPC0_9SPHI|nr:hypothetical protein [Pedobacter polaris]TKC09901.1 hypothetical protein FA048_06720 [Pedobacter polaris]